MPYKVFKVKNKYVVKVKKGGKWHVKKAYTSKSKADKYMKALYANTKD